METCKETSKAIAIHVGTGKECGKEASDMKCAIEHPEDPDIQPPTPLSSTDEKKKTLWFGC